MAGRAQLYSIFIFLFVLATINGKHTKRTVRRTLVTATPNSEDEVKRIREILDKNSIADVWEPPRGVDKPVRFVVDDEEQGQVIDSLRGVLLGTTQFLDLDTTLYGKASTTRRSSTEFDLYNYNSHADIGEFTADKRAVWMDAGIHAREWIAPATALYIIEQLANGVQNNDDEVMSLLETYVIYILPSANPDGYEYSRTTDRLWRKTRSGSDNGPCVGADPNRNWDFHWNEIGASSNPCSYIYAGPEPFSEIETRNVADYLWRHRERFDVYLTFHAYGQAWLCPWGYTADLPEDYDDLMEVANAGLEALEAVHGSVYTAGTSTNIFYPAAGGSDDWAKGVAGIKYSYTLELTSGYGFEAPAEVIQPTGEETWEAVKACIQKVTEKNKDK